MCNRGVVVRTWVVYALYERLQERLNDVFQRQCYVLRHHVADGRHGDAHVLCHETEVGAAEQSQQLRTHCPKVIIRRHDLARAVRNDLGDDLTPLPFVDRQRRRIACE